MDKKYTFDTIEECKKQIIDKCMILDVNYITNYSLLECFSTMVKTIIIFIMIISTILIWLHVGFKATIMVLLILVSIFYAGKVVMSFVKESYDKSYNKSKIALFNYILSNCREYNETNYKDWERKQIIEKLSSLANLKVDWTITD